MCTVSIGEIAGSVLDWPGIDGLKWFADGRGTPESRGPGHA